MTTKIKRIKLKSIRPPREIRDIKMLRHDWLKRELVRINAIDGMLAKIVGKGSYEEIAVYELKEVAARTRYRGHCQFCGNTQVVQEGGIVLHGYTRPGDGRVFGSCPGVGLSPLQLSDAVTRTWHNGALERRDKVAVLLSAAENAARVARDLYYGSEDFQLRTIKPPCPRLTFRPTQEEREAYKSAYNDWSTVCPLAAGNYEAANKERDLKTAFCNVAAEIAHFKTLLNLNLPGTALIEEKV
jgi:hypothetical protein